MILQTLNNIMARARDRLVPVEPKPSVPVALNPAGDFESLGCSASVAATGTLTSDNTAPADGALVQIGPDIYIARTALTASTTKWEVLINGTADAFMLNLIRALNRTGTPGTDYGSDTPKNTNIRAATSVTAHAFVVTALIPGAIGNLIATPTPGTHLSWGAATLTGGLNAVLSTAATLAAGTASIGSLAAGEAVIGKTVGVSTLVTSAVVFTDTNARATGDYCGTDTTPQAFLLASRVSGNCAVVKSIRITDYTTTAAVALELWLFSATFTAPADNAAWAITDAEAVTCLGVIPISTSKWYASSNNKVYSDDTLGLVIKPGVTSLFYAIVARGTTPAWTTAAGLNIGLGILQD